MYQFGCLANYVVVKRIQFPQWTGFFCHKLAKKSQIAICDRRMLQLGINGRWLPGAKTDHMTMRKGRYSSHKL